MLKMTTLLAACAATALIVSPAVAATKGKLIITPAKPVAAPVKKPTVTLAPPPSSKPGIVAGGAKPSIVSGTKTISPVVSGGGIVAAGSLNGPTGIISRDGAGFRR